MSQTVTITRLAHLGDGVAETLDGPVFVPLALPGETVRVGAVSKSRAVLEEILEAAPGRVDPACPHFGECGGCSLQHMADPDVAAFKRAAIQGALDRQGVNHNRLAETLTVSGQSRRRLTLKAIQTERGVILGFSGRGSHQIVNIEACPVAHPDIVAALPSIRDLFGTVFARRSRGEVQITHTTTGLDVHLTVDREPTLDDRFDMAEVAEGHDWARLSWNGEILSERRAPLLTMGVVDVALPVGGFLQATAETDRLFAELIKERVKGAKRIADLFAGIGTISLPLAIDHHVTAIESDAAAVNALRRAADPAAGQGRINPLKVETRDLFRRPLMPAEMKGFDAVVFDPPRAGAQAQCEQLAQSAVPLVIGVSCDPKSFARDARILTDGGYTLDDVIPIDQFRWSAHVEMIGVFRR